RSVNTTELPSTRCRLTDIVWPSAKYASSALAGSAAARQPITNTVNLEICTGTPSLTDDEPSSKVGPRNAELIWERLRPTGRECRARVNRASIAIAVQERTSCRRQS